MAFSIGENYKNLFFDLESYLHFFEALYKPIYDKYSTIFNCVQITNMEIQFNNVKQLTFTHIIL